MDWDFAIARLSVWSVLSAVEALPDVEAEPSPTWLHGCNDLDDTAPPPWLELGLLAEATDRQCFSLHVELLDDFVRHRGYALEAMRRYYEPLSGVAHTAGLYLAPWDEPSVLVDDEYFDWRLVERLLFSPPAIRRRIMWPTTHSLQELAVLDELEADYTVQDAVRHAIEQLETRFGRPLCLEPLQAKEAARLVRDATFLHDPAALLDACPEAFSPVVRRRMNSWWHALSNEPF